MATQQKKKSQKRSVINAFQKITSYSNTLLEEAQQQLDMANSKKDDLFLEFECYRDDHNEFLEERKVLLQDIARAKRAKESSDHIEGLCVDVMIHEGDNAGNEDEYKASATMYHEQAEVVRSSPPHSRD